MSYFTNVYGLLEDDTTEDYWYTLNTTDGHDLTTPGGHDLTTQSIIMSQKNETKSMKVQLAMYDILIPSLGAFIIITNLAVVISSGLLLKKRQQPRCTYLLLGNVAMADLVTGVAVIFGQVFPKSHRDHAICSVQLGMIVSSTIASIYSVALIAIDRFLYILHGIKYQQWVYPTRARISIAATWFLGLIIGFLPAMGWYGETDNGRICWFIMMAPRNLVVLTTIIGIAPVLLVCVLYSIILYHAIKKVIQLRRTGKDKYQAKDSNDPTKMRIFRGGQSAREANEKKAIETPIELESQSHQTKIGKFLNRFKRVKVFNVNEELAAQQNAKPNNPSKWKAIKVVLFTTGSFVCTWVPYFIACTMYVFCDPKETPQKCYKLRFAIASPLAILGFMNSLLNPVIYAWWHNGFRKSMKKICCRRRNDGFLGKSKGTGKSNASKSSQNTSSTVQTFTPLSSSIMES